MSTRNTLILAVAGVVSFYFLNKQKNFDKSYYYKEIESLQKKVDSISNINGVLTLEVTSLEGKLIKYSSQIDSLEISIVEIKQTTDEKLNNSINFTLSELQSFFTDRYNTGSTSSRDSSSISSKRFNNR